VESSGRSEEGRRRYWADECAAEEDRGGVGTMVDAHGEAERATVGLSSFVSAKKSVVNLMVVMLEQRAEESCDTMIGFYNSGQY